MKIQSLINQAITEITPRSGLPVLTPRFIEDTVEQITIKNSWNVFVDVMNGVKELLPTTDIVINYSYGDFIKYKKVA